MALRVSLARQVAGLARVSGGRMFSSTRAAASLSESVKQSIKRDAALPNPDPASDSASAALVNDHSPYMVATYARPPPVFVQGEGSWLWDIENRKYLDFTAGIAVTSLGHSDAEFADIIANQAKTLIHASNLYYNPWTGALSKLLIEKTLESGCMHEASKVFICNSGTEANEAAIKFARKVGKIVDPSGDKVDIVSFSQSFHGRTMGALSATHNPKYQKPFAPMVPGFKQGTFNDVAAINDLVNETTCGVIVEPIQGEGGIFAGSEEFMVALAKRCRQVGAILIYDEIQSGLSRTGQLWAHGNLPKEAHPDILTTAKALGNGFPIAAVLVTEAVADKIKQGDHGTTFGGNPLACRLAHYVVSKLASPDLQEGVLAKSRVFTDRFAKLQAKFPDLITESRGRGLILGLQLTEDPSAIVKAARERGLLVITAGTNTLRFLPSLVMTEEEIQHGLDILEEAIVATRS
ncbi:pyridoxal phosphate-dependent transferase [Trichoderma barbatum]